MFYNAVISSTISFEAACWGGNVSKHDQGRVVKAIYRASVIVGRQTTSSLCIEGKCFIKLVKYSDLSHPFHVEFCSHLSHRSSIFLLTP